MTRETITRRAALTSVLGIGGAMLAGCDKLSQNQTFQKMLETAEHFNLGGQRLALSSGTPLAREYARSDISRVFKANGTVRPESEEYGRLAVTGFSDWRLKIEGLVERPAEL